MDGSAAECDVHLAEPGVAAVHARIVNQGGQLLFVDDGTGRTFVNWQQVPQGSIHPFDFRTPAGGTGNPDDVIDDRRGDASYPAR